MKKLFFHTIHVIIKYNCLIINKKAMNFIWYILIGILAGYLAGKLLVVAGSVYSQTYY